jgi:two-component system CitB family sensor kinase
MGSRRRVPGLGHVITLRDRTELDHALRELDETRSLTDALRAQQHEFSNRMHVLAGLLDLGRVEEAAGYARELDGSSATGFEAQISDTRIVALLLAKASVAREHAVTLDVRCDRPVRIDDEYGDALVSIVGNLVDNAIEALRPGGQVGVTFGDDGAALVIDVVDDGPGIPAGAEEAIFTGGWSTKDANGRPRGIGLALVRQLVLRMGGTIEVLPGDGAHFRVTLPRVRVPS